MLSPYIEDFFGSLAEVDFMPFVSSAIKFAVGDGGYSLFGECFYGSPSAPLPPCSGDACHVVDPEPWPDQYQYKSCTGSYCYS
eukprot:883192-Amphidinium_carterae.2